MSKVFLHFLLVAGIFLSVSGSEKARSVKELISPRGIKFWLARDSSATLVCINIVFKNAGSAHQERSKAGVPVLFSSTVLCGSGKYSKTQFDEKCCNLVIEISSAANEDNVCFSCTASKLVLSEAIDLFNMAITSPNFEEDKTKMIQNGIGSSLQNYAASPLEIVFFSIMPSIIFKLYPYERGRYGSEEDFFRLSIEDLRRFKDKFLVTSNVELCMVGDLSEEEAVILVDKIFSGVEEGNPSPDNLMDVTPQLNSEIKRYYAGGPQSSIFFALKTEPPKSSKRHAAMLLYKILGEGYVFKGRILSKLRTERGLIYSGTVFPVDLKHSSYIFGELQTDNSKAQRAIELLKAIIKDLRENGITERELRFAKNNIKGRMAVALRTSMDICNFYIHKKLQGFGTEILSEELENIERPTLVEVNSLAREILNEGQMSFVVIGGMTK
ncbi:MAG: insulinase family protein [Holosporaceae bacterium]|nr:insulinase family protein [Holosporaceae bacterium]